MKTISEILFRVYLALVSLVTLFIILVYTGMLLDTGLRTYVFPSANMPRYLTNCEYEVPKTALNEETGEEEPISEEEREERCDRITEREIENYRSQQASQAVTSLSFLITTLPIFILHFLAFFRDWKRSKK